MNLNIIRSAIFIIAGLVMIFFPKSVIKVQNDILKRFKVKTRIQNNDKANLVSGIIFVVVGIVLLF